MKKTVISIFIGLFLITNVNIHLALANNEEATWNDPQIIDDFNFQTTLTENGVKMTWNVINKTDFQYYKVIRSTTNNNPVYPDDGYIYYSDDPSTSSYLDQTPEAGKKYFYRVCLIQTPNRYCSNVQNVNIPEGYYSSKNSAELSSINKDDVQKALDEMNLGLDVDFALGMLEKMGISFDDLVETANNIDLDQIDVDSVLKNLDENSWFFPYAEKMAQNDLLAWDGAINEPYEKTTRGHAVALMVKAYEKMNGPIQVTTTHTFLDVPTQHWTYEYLKKALSIGMIASNPSFYPEKTIKRSEVAKIMANTFYKNDVDSSKNSGFSDVPENHWAAKYIKVIKNKKLVTGYEDGTFKPEGEISNAELFKIIINSIEKKDPTILKQNETI